MFSNLFGKCGKLFAAHSLLGEQRECSPDLALRRIPGDHQAHERTCLLGRKLLAGDQPSGYVREIHSNRILAVCYR
jgi:hypothetical protein